MSTSESITSRIYLQEVLDRPRPRPSKPNKAQRYKKPPGMFSKVFRGATAPFRMAGKAAMGIAKAPFKATAYTLRHPIKSTKKVASGVGAVGGSIAGGMVGGPVGSMVGWELGARPLKTTKTVAKAGSNILPPVAAYNVGKAMSRGKRARNAGRSRVRAHSNRTRINRSRIRRECQSIIDRIYEQIGVPAVPKYDPKEHKPVQQVTRAVLKDQQVTPNPGPLTYSSEVIKRSQEGMQRANTLRKQLHRRRMTNRSGRIVRKED